MKFWQCSQIPTGFVFEITVHRGKLEHPQNRRPPLFRLRSTISPPHFTSLHETLVRAYSNSTINNHLMPWVGTNPTYSTLPPLQSSHLRRFGPQ